jgi:hypothetical protein
VLNMGNNSAKPFGYVDKKELSKQNTAIHWDGTWEFRHFDANSDLIWEHTAKNSLANEGEESMLDSYLRNQNNPSTFYVRLFNDTPTETDSLGAITGEPSTNGYAPQEITRNTSGWVSLALDSGDFQATSSEETFSASGGSWGPVTYAVLATTSGNAGKHIAFVALSQSRTLADGESLKVTLKVKQT